MAENLFLFAHCHRLSKTVRVVFVDKERITILNLCGNRPIPFHWNLTVKREFVKYKKCLVQHRNRFKTTQMRTKLVKNHIMITATQTKDNPWDVFVDIAPIKTNNLSNRICTFSESSTRCYPGALLVKMKHDHPVWRRVTLQVTWTSLIL